MKQYDIAIVGGGMVGAALANALKNTAFSILLIDASPLQASMDHRLIALTYNSCQVFKNLTLWPALQPHATEIKKIHVSSRGHFGATRIAASEVNLPQLGYLIPAKAINAALTDQLAQQKNLTIVRPAKLTALTQQPDHVTLTIENDRLECCSAKLVMAADGTHSTVRELLGIGTEKIAYHQKALVSQIDLQRHHQHIAYERFLPTGAIAMLPLGDSRAALIWTDQTERVDALLKLSDREFLQELQQHFGFRLGKFLHVHHRAFYPLQFVQAKQQAQGRVLLMGNAAHTLHPIASQGLNLALYEIAVLAEQLGAQTPHSLSLPDLTDYFKQQQISIDLSHRLAHLFSANFLGIQAARQLGLIGLDNCAMAKTFFIKRAMGSAGFIPKLFRND